MGATLVSQRAAAAHDCVFVACAGGERHARGAMTKRRDRTRSRGGTRVAMGAVNGGTMTNLRSLFFALGVALAASCTTGQSSTQQRIECDGTAGDLACEPADEADGEATCEDVDEDGDGTPNDEGGTDVDGDGVVNGEDPDDDGDGAADVEDPDDDN